MDQQAEKEMTERVLGLGRRTRQEIVKWNQMTALRFQTGGRHQTSPASLWGTKESKLSNNNNRKTYTTQTLIYMSSLQHEFATFVNEVSFLPVSILNRLTFPL